MKNVLGRGLSSLVSTPAVPVRVPNTNAALKIENSEGTEGQSGIYSTNVPSSRTETAYSTKTESNSPNVSYIPIADIEAGQFQPRQDFSEAELRELASSIQTHGVLQPILLRKNAYGAKTQYELIAGERRWRAAQVAGLLEVPAIIKDLSNQESLEIAIIENVQRNDLNPLEEARAYNRLQTEFSLTQEQVAQKVGKERATVANLLRLLKLAPEVQELVKSGNLSAGHAKTLLTIKEPAAQLSLAKKAMAEGLSVRSLENVISRVVVLDTGTRKATGQFASTGQGSENIPTFPDVIERLRNALATKVTLKHKKDGSGCLEIQYHSETELDRLVEVLSK